MRLPRTIGRYELLDLLGKGGSGAVYRGREHGDLGLTHDVAIKVLSASYERMGGRAAFADEARMLARIAHPCVVPIRNFTLLQDEDLGELPVIVMPLVRGTKLSTLLRTCRREGVLMPLAASLHLLLQLADALEAVHSATDEEGRHLQIVHRDLKPANLMVSPQGDLRVLDFGIAWANQREAEKTQNVVKGTLRYLSPEQIGGLEPDGRSDLYAVGAVAFEMLVGEPFVRTEDDRDITGAVLGALLRTRLVHRLPALRLQLREAHGLSQAEAEHVTDLLVRLLQTDRDKRFPHARALSAALDAVAEGRPLRRARRWLGRVADGAPVAERANLTVPTPVVEDPDDEPSPSGGQDREPRSVLPWLLAALVVAGVGLGWWASRWRPEPPRIRLMGAEAAVSLPEAPDDAPTTPTVTHAPPRPLPPSGDRVFRAELPRDGVDCMPFVHLRSVDGGPWVTKAMDGDDRRWEVRVAHHELAAFPGGAEYWIRCGSPEKPAVAAWRSAKNPARLPL